jgi:hypothetical protein
MIAGLLGYFQQEKFHFPIYFSNWTKIVPWGGYTPFFESTYYPSSILYLSFTEKTGNWDDMIEGYVKTLADLSATESEYQNSSTGYYISCSESGNFSDPANYHICRKASEIPTGM